MDATTASRANSTPDVQGPNGKSSLPSCNLCRKRKIKCDRVDPCQHCQRSGMKCVFAAPSRLPRGRQGGRRKADSELLQRIAKLEGLVKNLEGDSSSPASKTDLSSGSDVGMTQQRQLPATDPVKVRHKSQDEAGPNYDKPFLRTISDEISGLRYVLGSGQSDDEDDELESDDESEGGQDHDFEHSRFAICGPGWVVDPGRESQIDSQLPSFEQQLVLCEAYMANVHPVTKILHGPSLRAYLHRTKSTLDCSPGPKGLKALMFAVFHVATISFSEEECRQKLGEERYSLIRRYRLATELALAKADFVNTTEMSTLQALVLFLQAIRAYDKSRFAWTLISLAARIAQALGLQRENNHSSLPLFQREMRRRLWWTICAVDSAHAQDRGTNPAIEPESYNTRKPLLINDEDIWLGGPEEVQERRSYADMTFVSVCYDVYETVRQLNYVSAGEQGGNVITPAETQTQRIDRVLACQRRLEDRYLQFLDMAIPFHWACRMVADVIRACLWLYAYRPLQHRPGFGSENQHPNLLHLSVEILEKSKTMDGHPAAASFNWISSAYVQWHPLGVTLAELCVQIEGPLVERAWQCVDNVYDFVGSNIAGTSKGPLWRPIKKLYQKAQKVRQSHLQEVGYAAKEFPDFSQMEITSTEPATTTTPAIDFSTVTADTMDAVDIPPEWLKTPDIMQGSFNWTPWGQPWEQSAEVPSIATGGIAWNNFVDDFQGGEFLSEQEFANMYNYDIAATR